MQVNMSKPITRRMARELTYKKEESSDDDDDYDDDCEDIDMSEDEDDILSEGDDDFIVKDKNKINPRNFQNLLSELFPSKYMEKKRENASNPEVLTGANAIPLGNIPIGNKAPIFTKPKQKRSKLIEEEPISPSKMFSQMQNFNIIFTVGSGFNAGSENKDIEDYESYHSSDDPDYDPDMEEVEDNSSPIDSEEYDASEVETDTNELDTDEVDTNEVDTNEVDTNEVDTNEVDTNEVDTNEVDTNTNDVCCDMDIDVMKDNMGLIINERTKKNKGTGRKTFKQQQERNTKKLKFKNALKFKELLQQKNVMNDLNYFQEKMSLKQQELVLKQMEELKSIVDIEKPYRLSLLEADIPPRFKAAAYNKLSTLKSMEPGCSEYNKIKHWVDDFMRIPFNKINHLPVCIEDGVEKCHDFMADAKNTLDKAVYGLNDVKLQVMQMVGQWITNPDAIGNAVAIEGPPGTGKTTLVKEGISKILNREFIFIPLGGATDSSCLEGHSYTYEGSSCGLIVKQLIQCQSMNPIIYFDELDKISDTPKGEEIVGILTHLTDTSQNSNFHDKYFAEFDFDLSRCVFFFSYNDRSKVNKILLDRMHCIMTKGYEMPQKSIIAKDYLLPTIRSQVKFKPEEIVLPDETIEHIINSHTHKEDGVRNLKRCLEIIHTKLNLYRLMKPGTNLFEGDMDIKVEFPITVTPKIVDKLIKQHKEIGSWQNMYS
jgi:ATP-dependent Lon protease